jgi:hypothetical protein
MKVYKYLYGDETETNMAFCVEDNLKCINGYSAVVDSCINVIPVIKRTDQCIYVNKGDDGFWAKIEENDNKNKSLSDRIKECKTEYELNDLRMEIVIDKDNFINNQELFNTIKSKLNFITSQKLFKELKNKLK